MGRLDDDRRYRRGSPARRRSTGARPDHVPSQAPDRGGLAGSQFPLMPRIADVAERIFMHYLAYLTGDLVAAIIA